MKSIIKIEHMFKSFQTANGSVTALRDINLDIAHGEIFGIIGLSGAGKVNTCSLHQLFGGANRG